MATLPVSGFAVRCRVPDGRDDLSVREGRGHVVEQALAILARLVIVDENAFAGWATVTVTDFEGALLVLRRFLFGDRVACMFRCTRCAERMEIEFSASALLAEAKPKRRISEEGGWIRSSGGRFRLPLVADQLQVLGRPQAQKLLEARCVEGRARGAASAMAAMAPLISRSVAGCCQACGTVLSMLLYVPALVVDELRVAAAGVHEEIHTIAAAYHWSEAEILNLPQARRQAYAETIERQRRLAG